MLRKQTPRPYQKSHLYLSQQFHLLSQLRLKQKRMKLRKRHQMRLRKFQRNVAWERVIKYFSLQSYWFWRLLLSFFIIAHPIPACQMFLVRLWQRLAPLSKLRSWLSETKRKNTATKSNPAKSLKLIHRPIVSAAKAARLTWLSPRDPRPL